MARMPGAARPRTGLHYYDVIAALNLVILVSAGAATVRQGPSWGVSEFALTVCFAATLAMLGVLRHRAYSQAVPWIVGAFSVSSIALAFVMLSRLPVVVFAAGIGAVLLLMVLGGILRSKPLSEPIAVRDVARLLAIAASAGLAIIACEAALRFVPGLVREDIYRSLRADPRNYGVAHPYIGHLQTPHNEFEVSSGTDFQVVHSTGEHGFPSRAPWPDRTDIVVLGDSVVFGYGVAAEEAWPSVLSREIAPTRVLNLGLIGGGPQQYVRVYETFGVELQPRLVVFGLFTGNDFGNAATFDSWLRSGSGGNYLVWRDFGRPRRIPFTLRQFPSALENLARARLYPLLRRSSLFNLVRVIADEDENGGSVEGAVFRVPDGRAVALNPAGFKARAAVVKPGTQEFDLTLEALKDADRMASMSGARLLVLIQPSKEEVYLPLLGTQTSHVLEPLHRALQEAGIEYLDLTAAFQERATAGEPLFFERDGHPNATGYSLIAEVVGSHIRQNAQRHGLN